VFSVKRNHVFLAIVLFNIIAWRNFVNGTYLQQDNENDKMPGMLPSKATILI
jgi:hypothetical protein